MPPCASPRSCSWCSLLAGCGGSSHRATSRPRRALTGVRDGARRRPRGTAQRFTLVDRRAASAASPITSSETGTRLVRRSGARTSTSSSPAAGCRRSSIVDGPFTYTNANVEAALNDPTVKPWTKLDTRRLTAKQIGDAPRRARARPRARVPRRRRRSAPRVSTAEVGGRHDPVPRRASTRRGSLAQRRRRCARASRTAVRNDYRGEAVPRGLLARRRGAACGACSSATARRGQRDRRRRRASRTSAPRSTRRCRPRARSRTSRP